MSALPRVIVEWSPTTGLLGTPVWRDESHRLLEFEVRRGKKKSLGRWEAGRATLTLDNADNALDPLNAAAPAPYAGNVKARRSWRVRTEWPWVGLGNPAHAVGQELTNADSVRLAGWSGANATLSVLAIPEAERFARGVTHALRGTVPAGAAVTITTASGARIPLPGVGEADRRVIVTFRVRSSTGGSWYPHLYSSLADGSGDTNGTGPAVTLTPGVWARLSVVLAVGTLASHAVLQLASTAATAGTTVDVAAIAVDADPSIPAGSGPLDGFRFAGFADRYLNGRRDGRRVVTVPLTDWFGIFAQHPLPRSPYEVEVATLARAGNGPLHRWYLDEPAGAPKAMPATTGSPAGTYRAVTGQNPDGKTAASPPLARGSSRPGHEQTLSRVTDALAGDVALPAGSFPPAGAFSLTWQYQHDPFTAQHTIYEAGNSDQRNYLRVDHVNGFPRVTVVNAAGTSFAGTAPAVNGTSLPRLFFLRYDPAAAGGTVTLHQVPTYEAGTVDEGGKPFLPYYELVTLTGVGTLDLSGKTAGRFGGSGPFDPASLNEGGATVRAADLAVWPRLLSTAELTTLSNAFRLGHAGETPSVRAARVLDNVGVPSASRSLGTTVTPLSEHGYQGNALQLLERLAETDVGAHYVYADGTYRLRGRRELVTGAGATVQATFGNGPGEVPASALDGGGSGYERLLTFVRRGNVGRSTVERLDAAKRDEYGELPYSRTDLLAASDEDAVDSVDYLHAVYGTPLYELEELELSPVSPATARQVLTRELEDRVRARIRNLGQPMLELEAHILGISERYSVGSNGQRRWLTRFWLSPATPATFLVLDHPTAGQLDTGRLAY